MQLKVQKLPQTVELFDKKVEPLMSTTVPNIGTGSRYPPFLYFLFGLLIRSVEKRLSAS